jgi:hypothetical protein
VFILAGSDARVDESDPAQQVLVSIKHRLCGGERRSQKRTFAIGFLAIGLLYVLILHQSISLR